MNFFIKSQKAFGLDISSSSIKLVECDKKGSKLALKGYSEVPLPKGLILADQISDKPTFEHLLKQALYKPLFGKITTKYVVTNLPETKSFVRVIQIPLMSEAEAESAVPFEAENFIPMPIDQVYLDWQKLSETGEKMNILIIASPREFVDSFLTGLEKCGVKPLALEVESQSCHRALVDPAKKETSLIVDMSEARTSLIMVEDGNLQFTSTIPIAGSSFTETIARTLGVSSAKAEMIKVKVGITNTAEYPNIKTAVLPVLNNLSAEIKNILKFHTEHSGKPIQKIILTGGTSKLKNLTEFVAQSFADQPSIRVELGNPWSVNLYDGQPPLDPYDSLSFTTAIGLGIRGAGPI